MPPKKRVRKSPPSEDAPAPAPKPPLPADANTGTVFELPNEIWLEILSHFPSVRIPTLIISGSQLLPSSTLEREHILRALSQTCRAFRAFFLPELWQRFEVCASPKQVEMPTTRYAGSCSSSVVDDFYLSGPWYKHIAEALEKKSNGLRESPDHAKYVQTVSVALTRCQAATVLDAFVRCLKVLPNLRTLQILRAHTQMTTHLKTAFEKHKIPTVHTIVLPDHAHNVLRACPEARVVMCNYDDGRKLIGAIVKECKKVEVLRGFRPDVNMMKRIVKGVPNLQEISMEWSSTEVVQMLSALKHIRAIELRIKYISPPDSQGAEKKPDLPHLKAYVDTAKKVLLDKAKGRDMKEKEKMWFRLRFHDTRYDKTVVEEVPLGLVSVS